MKDKLLILITLLFSAISLSHGMEQEKKTRNPLLAGIQRPNETCIAMGETKSISTSPEIKSPLIISTVGLTDELTTVLHVKYSNGDQYAGMIRCLSLSNLNNQHNIALQSLCLQARTNQNKSKKIIATNFFFSPAKNDKTLINYQIQEKNTQEIYDLFNATVHTELQKMGTVQSYRIPHNKSDPLKLCDNHDMRDIEMILYPDKATLSIDDQVIELTDDDVSEHNKVSQ